MATLETRLQDNGYNNWVKGGLSLDVARDGVVNFVEINIDNYHQDVMNSLPAGSSCRNCTTENVIPCRNNNNLCKFQNRTCNVHDSNDPNKRSQNCPNLVCDKIQIAIVKEHRFNGPAWRNTDSQHWCREPWQLAKCFMSQGYASPTSASDTDLPGLLSVVINNKRFNNVVTDNLSAKNNIFCQAREVRNKILHSPNMQLTDQELQDCILVLDNMLSDSKSLAADCDAGQARTMLDKILNDQINITTENERQVRALREMDLTKTGALAEIQTEKIDAIDAMKKELTNTKDVIQTEKIDAIDAVKKEQIDIKYVIKAEKKDAIDAVKNELTDTKDAIQTEKKDAIDAVKNELTDTKDAIQTEKIDAIDAVKKELTDTKGAIQTEKTDAIDAVKNELTDTKDAIQTEKIDAIDAVKNELTDTKGAIQTEKIDAIDALKKEQTDTRDVLKAEKEEAITAVKTEFTQIKDVIKAEKENVIAGILEKNYAIKAEKDDAIESVKKELTEAKDDIIMEKTDAVRAVQTEFTKTKDEIKAEKEKAIAGILEKKYEIEAEKEIAAFQTVSEDTYRKIKQDMKAQLISIYQQDEQLSAPLFPLVLTDQKKIDELYVKPYMKHKEKTIGSYKDIFKDERKKIYVVGDAGLGKTSLCQKMVSTWCRVHSKLVENMSDDKQPMVQKEPNSSEIVENMSDDKQPMVQKEPNSSEIVKNMSDDKQPMVQQESNLSKNTGLGKTSRFQKIKYFCCFQSEAVEDRSDEEQPMVLKETNLSLDKKVTDGSHLAEKKKCLDDDNTRKDDEQTMAQFDFLFYISLREADKENDVEDMIKDQILSEEFHEHISTVLKEEKVLIILDGLDEWYGDSTDKRRQGRLVNKGIPAIRTMMKNGTILTTTRPWKLEAIQLKSTQIDAKIALLGIETVSSEKLIQIMLHHLNKENNCQMEMKDFVSELEDKKLEHFMAIPVILKQLICLWHSGKKLGLNKTTIYCQMVELLFQLGQTRLYQDPKLQYENKKEKWMKSSIILPACFDTNDQCRHHKPLLTGLSKVAFKTLLCENQESSLVFKRSEAEIHGMSAEDINICLKIGILSQSGVIKNCMSHIHISFLHKTYQEFFAALFVSVDPTESDQSVQTIQDVCNSEDKCLEMKPMITFISGMSSEITCQLMTHIKPLLRDNNYGYYYIVTKQTYMCDCLREGWCCNHGNIHLQCDAITIDTKHQPEHLELLCQANIHHMKTLCIESHPTAWCLEYLLQVDTLKILHISWLISSSISEDNLYSLIQHNTHTLTQLAIWDMTLQSRASLTTLLYNIQHLSQLYILGTTMSQQLLDSLQEVKAQRHVTIGNPTILPDTECTD